jgi:hypothetical protein
MMAPVHVLHVSHSAETLTYHCWAGCQLPVGDEKAQVVKRGIERHMMRCEGWRTGRGWVRTRVGITHSRTATHTAVSTALYIVVQFEFCAACCITHPV